MSSPSPTSDSFPWFPMTAISIALFSHSYAVSNLFPYIGFMVQHLGVTDDKDEVGFYAGYVSSAMMVGRFGSSYFWGRFADRYGRLPVMYISICSIVIFSVAFGMSTSFYWAIVFRFLLGAMNGILATSKTVISEVCTKEQEVVGIGTITACWSLGLVLGPGIGGLFSEPAKHFPGVFSESGLFGRFPYLLPNLVGACIALAGLPTVFFFVPETKPTQARNGDGDRDVEDPDGADRGPVVLITQANPLEYAKRSDENIPSPLGKRVFTSASPSRIADDFEDIREEADTKNLVREMKLVLDNGGIERCDAALQNDARRLSSAGKDFDPQEAEVEAVRGDVGSSCWPECIVLMKLFSERKIRGIIISYGLISFIVIGIDEVYPLWALSTIAKGGLDWTSNEIGTCLSITGLAMVAFQLMIYPRMVKAMGIQGSQRLSSCVMVPLFAVIPLLSRLHGEGWVLVIANLVLLFSINAAANTIISNNVLATNNAVDPSLRSTINGISMTVGSLAEAVGPTAFAVTFAWSINRPHPFPFDYELVFYVLALLVVVLVRVSWDAISIPETSNYSAARERGPTATAKGADMELTGFSE